jgi:hypothetical protein
VAFRVDIVQVFGGTASEISVRAVAIPRSLSSGLSQSCATWNMSAIYDSHRAWSSLHLRLPAGPLAPHCSTWHTLLQWPPPANSPAPHHGTTDPRHLRRIAILGILPSHPTNHRHLTTPNRGCAFHLYCRYITFSTCSHRNGCFYRTYQRRSAPHQPKMVSS